MASFSFILCSLFTGQIMGFGKISSYKSLNSILVFNLMYCQSISLILFLSFFSSQYTSKLPCLQYSTVTVLTTFSALFFHVLLYFDLFLILVIILQFLLDFEYVFSSIFSLFSRKCFLYPFIVFCKLAFIFLIR